ncbi:MAG TPA: tetratricopeptide repeat protein [Desulfuromonadales bacterium]|nr:tetratricopeptide repeat protein [Desulfuromonadales bacterium]
MKPERYFILIALSVVLMATSGCSHLPGRNNVLSAQGVAPVERSFAAALQQLRAGNEAAAAELLDRVVNSASLPGVTDEALFRLALLELPGDSGGGEARARELLDQLIRYYPASIWSKQAAPLAQYLRGAAAVKARNQQIKNLKNQNVSLSRDNKELRQSIERLKNLDLELEQKIRR